MKYSVNITKMEIQNLKAFVSVVIENKIVITGIKIIQGKKGLFLSMPSYKNKDGEYKDYCFVIDKDERKKLEDLIFKKYESGDSDV
ncbi:MAG: SpoVG family protein [Clostridia bacterium]